MEKLNNKYKNLCKIYSRLSRIQQKYTNPPSYADEEDMEAYMTTMVKRFELTFELLWKFLKFYLKFSQGIDTLGSKDVIRRSLNLGLVTEHEGQALLDIVEERNAVAHDYDEDRARELCEKIVHGYYQMFSEIVPRLEKFTKNEKNEEVK